jgi:hypothetical protein
MHRSGTSALTGALERCGVYLGRSYIRELYEHEFSVNLNTHLLSDLGSSWDDVFMLPNSWWQSSIAVPHRQRLIEVLRKEFGDKPIWAVKDPRLCITLPLWLDVFNRLGIRPHFVFALRHPGEICKSHKRRDGFDHPKTMMIWMNYLLTAERHTRSFTRCFVLYEDLLKAPEACLSVIQRKLDLQLPRAWAEARDDIMAFIDPGMKHHDSGGSRLPADIPDAVTELWELLRRQCHDDIDPMKTLDSIDSVHARYRSLHSFFLNSQLETEVKNWRDQQIRAMKILNDIGHDHIVRGRLDAAMEFFQRMANAFPTDPRIHNNLGIVYEVKGDLHRANDCFKTAHRIEPLYTMARQNLERLQSI